MYKFNNGRGAVICDNCRVIMDQNISLKDYESLRTKFNFELDECWRCKEKHKKDVKPIK